MLRFGLEAEFIFVRHNGNAVGRKDILGVWHYFIQKGWKEKRDAYNGELIGVKKETRFGPIVMDNDGSALLLEVAWPPYPDMRILRREVRALVRDMRAYCGSRYRLLGYGCAPFTKPGTMPLTPKGYYPVLFELIRGNRPLWYTYICGALQMNISNSLPDLIRAYNVFAALTGPLFALGANTSVYDSRLTRYRDIRGRMYDRLQPYFKKGYDATVGVPSRPLHSWKEYFTDLLSRPGHLLMVGGAMVEVLDSRPLGELFLKQKPVRVREIQRAGYPRNREQEVVLTINDIQLIQALCWRDHRLKFSFQSNTDTTAFIRAFRSSAAVFERFLEEHFSNSYIEIRPVAMQQPRDLFALPALTLGIMNNLEAAEIFIQSKPWSFWRSLRVPGYTTGMKAEINGVAMADLVLPIYDMAEAGLQQRKLGEEKYLQPLLTHIEHKKSPADVVEEIFVTQGKSAFLDALSITSHNI